MGKRKAHSLEKWKKRANWARRQDGGGPQWSTRGNVLIKISHLIIVWPFSCHFFLVSQKDNGFYYFTYNLEDFFFNIDIIKTIYRNIVLPKSIIKIPLFCRRSYIFFWCRCLLKRWSIKKKNLKMFVCLLNVKQIILIKNSSLIDLNFF